MDLIGVVISYFDSIVGCAALVVALMVSQNNRNTLRILENSMNSQVALLSQGIEAIHTQLKSDVEELEVKVSQYTVRQHDEYQLRSACLQQHEYINSRLTSFETRMGSFERKLEKHTEQILSAIVGGKQ